MAAKNATNAKSASSSPALHDNARSKAFDQLLGSLNKEFTTDTGDPIVARFGERSLDVPKVSSGSLVLDHLVGGGIPRGRVVEIFGPEASGKTSVALTTLGNIQREGGNAVFIDVESALDPGYAAKLGVDVPRMALAQPSTAEDVMNLVNRMVKSGVVDVIVVDSVAAMVPASEINGDAEDLTIGALARIMSKEVRKIIGPAAKNGTTVIFLNQVRDKIGAFSPAGTPLTTPGGKALPFYASLRIRVNKGKPVMNDAKGAEKKLIGNETNITIVKNKVAPPGGKGKTVLTFAQGINREAEMMEVGLDYGILARPTLAKWAEVETGEIIGTSKDKALEELRNNPELMARLEAALSVAIADRIAGRTVGDLEEPEDMGAPDDEGVEDAEGVEEE